MAYWNYPSQYPASYDFPPGWSVQIDNVDIVWANHPNSLASSISNLQQKLGLDNDPAVGFGGVQFDPTGHSTNPGSVGVPIIWIDTTTDPDGIPIYTDKNGISYDLRSSFNSAFIGYGYNCTLGIAPGNLVSISADDTLVLASSTSGLPADGMVVSVYGAGLLCDIAYRAEVTGLTGLVAGTTYYLGDNGLYVVEASIPLTATVKQEIGVARNTTTIVFNPTLVTEV
jgi:hypothetical protein